MKIVTDCKTYIICDNQREKEDGNKATVLTDQGDEDEKLITLNCGLIFKING